MCSINRLKEFLDEKFNKYNCHNFIESDPVSIPHKFSKKEDIEIAGFLAATIAWGNRKAILKSANRLIAWMDFAPYDFVVNHSQKELNVFNKFVYRTFNGIDCVYFLKSLQNIYKNLNGIESVFNQGYKQNYSVKDAIIFFWNIFFALRHEKRTQKHLANPQKGSAAKRINMYLRWMVRNDNKGVDFGIWKQISPADLMMPVDVHSGNIARELGLLTRKSNDWKAVEELTGNLRLFDSTDPVKYDFALFGLGVNNDF
jgi:uncharacterized protein (TIGR02757 family)